MNQLNETNKNIEKNAMILIACIAASIYLLVILYAGIHQNHFAVKLFVGGAILSSIIFYIIKKKM